LSKLRLRLAAHFTKREDQLRELQQSASAKSGTSGWEVKQRQTQRQRLRNLFEQREGEWIPLPEILSMSIAQFGARLKELRDIERMQIENKMERKDGAVWSWYRYTKPKSQQPLFPTHLEEVKQEGHYLEVLGRRI